MRGVWIIVVLLSFVRPRNIPNRPTRKWLHMLSVSWVGILTYKHDRLVEETVAGIILINTKLAIANAYEVSVIKKLQIRKTTKAMFLNPDGKVKNATVTGYILHPEFDEETLNTLALVKLEYDLWEFNWHLMEWPTGYSQMSEYPGTVFYLGYTDRHKILEQEMHKMEPVNKSACDAFYKNEQLDNKWMAPTAFQCYKKSFHSEPCVFESGMALAVLSKRKWTLLGMSVQGPGCSLPTRFIDFAQYVPWIEATTKTTRRWMPDTMQTWPHYERIILQKLFDDTIVMRPYDEEADEVIYGDCTKLDGELMYHEEGTFEAQGNATGIYGVTIWDEAYLEINCATLKLECWNMSLNPFNFNFGLAKYNEDLNTMIKSIPMVKKDQTVGPKYVHVRDEPWINWWFRKSHAKIANIQFKFDFYKTANISLKVFGKPPQTEAPVEEDEFLKLLKPYTIETYKRPRRPILW